MKREPGTCVGLALVGNDASNGVFALAHLFSLPRLVFFFSGRDFITDYTNTRVPHLLRIRRPAIRVYYSAHRVSQISRIALVAPNRAGARPEKIVVVVCAAFGPHADSAFCRQDEIVGKVVGVADRVFEHPAGHILVDGLFAFDLDVFAVQI